LSNTPKNFPGVKSPKLAGLLAVIPGVGYFYLGQYAKGAIFLISSFLFWPMLITIPLGIIDSVALAKRAASGHQLGRWEWFWTTIAVTPSLELVEFQANDRVEEPIGTDTRTIDNTKSPNKILRQIKTEYEWTFTYSVERELGHKEVDIKSVKLKEGGERTRTVEDLFSERYSSSNGERKTHQETVEVEVPGYASIDIIFHWKNIVEEGSIILRDKDQNEFILPYRAIVGVTFDLEQVENEE
jgi:hypothetical protein